MNTNRYNKKCYHFTIVWKTYMAINCCFDLVLRFPKMMRFSRNGPRRRALSKNVTALPHFGQVNKIFLRQCAGEG